MFISPGSVVALVAYTLALIDAATITVNNNGCPVSANFEMLLPHENCNQFYQCVNGRAVALECPSGLLFNQKIRACDWPQNVVCKRAYFNKNNPSEAPQICAAESSEGVLVAHEKCNQFYKCAHGLPVPLSCPSNLLYNPEYEICDWSQNVQCGDREIPSENDTVNDNGSSNDNENKDVEEDDKITNCKPSEAPAICAKEDSDGVLIAHEFCNQFYKCSWGKPVGLYCPSGLLYNSKKEQCDWPEQVTCGDREIPSENDSDNDSGSGSGNDDDNKDVEEDDKITNCDPSEAPAVCAKEDSDGVLVAHEFCNQFYKCSWGKPVGLYCPSGLLYNSKKEQCDWPKNVVCGEREIPSENDTDNDSGSGSGNDDDNKDVEEDDKITNCDPSEAPAICAKENSEGVLIAHEFCNQFYKCSWGKPVGLYCPSGLLYNSKKEQCDWPKNVVCGEREIPSENDADNDSGSGSGNDDDNKDVEEDDKITNCDPSEAPAICANENSDGVLIAHEFCNQFYKCSWGKPVGLYCPSGLLYNSKKEQCDWSSNVECGERIIPKEKEDENDDKETEVEQPRHVVHSNPSKHLTFAQRKILTVY